MLDVAATVVVWAACVHLVALGMLLLVSPVHGRRFLAGFAQTVSAHYLELGLRILVGAAFIAHAPKMATPTLFAALGWVLIGTSLALALLPWRWHARIAQRSVAMATRFTLPLGLASIAMGAGLAFAVLSGSAG
jgi:hypothetical protein